MTILGRAAGRKLHAISHNRDPRRVRPSRGRRSIGSQSALGSRRRTPQELDAVAIALVDRVTRRMRRGGRVGRTVVLRLRFSDFTRATRSKTLPRPTAATATILSTLRALLTRRARDDPPPRAHAARGLDHQPGARRAGVQLELAVDGQPPPALDITMDAIRDRYGTTRAAAGHAAGPKRPDVGLADARRGARWHARKPVTDRQTGLFRVQKGISWPAH